MRRTFIPLFITGLIFGCTPDDYQRSADRDVRKLLEDRKPVTLGYEPQTIASPQTANRPAKLDYDRIPATPLPPATQPALAAGSDFGVVPLGPEMRFPRGTKSGMITFEGQLMASRLAGVVYTDRLRLGPTSPADQTVRLELFSAIRYAVVHSRDYRSRMEDVFIEALQVTQERHMYDFRPFVRTGVGYRGGQGDVAYESALTATIAAGVSKQLPWGGEVVAEGLVDWVESLREGVEDGESANLVLRGNMPLLRGFGRVNQEDLIQQERDLVYSIRDFEEYRRQFAVDITTAYFDLLVEQQAVNNRRLNVANLTTLTARTQALYAAGRISFLEVQRSAQAALDSEDRLVQAAVRLGRRLDDFKLRLGMPATALLQVIPIELDLNAPVVDAAEGMRQAWDYRLRVRTADDRIDDARRKVEVARNGLLPDLDLVARGSVGNRVDTDFDAIDGRTTRYLAGLTLDLPIDRLDERNAYRIAMIGYERSRRDLGRVQDEVAVEVRDAARGMDASAYSIRVSRTSVELAKRRLDFANDLLRQGKVNARDVVEAQQALLEAQDRLDRGRADSTVNALRYLRTTGQLRVDPAAGELGMAMDRAAHLNRLGELGIDAATYDHAVRTEVPTGRNDQR